MKKIFTIIIALFALTTFTAEAQLATNVSAIAGNQAGYSNGTGYGSAFNGPIDIERAPSGDYYVADRNNRRIRKVTPAGVASSIAGSGSAGNSNGTGGAASFGSMQGITVDGNGNIYVTDGSYKTIRKITPTGVVTTLATGFGDPWGLCADAVGNIYVADKGFNRIVKVLPNGTKVFWAGAGIGGYVNGQGTSAKFLNPTDIDINANGDFYVADGGNNRIRKITSTGLVSNFSGNGSNSMVNGTATTSSYLGLYHITCSGSSLFITEIGASANRVRRVASDGSASFVAGAATWGITNGPGATARFKYPHGLTTDGAGNILVADEGNHRIRFLTMPASTLPVMLAQFKVVKKNSSAFLSWNTMSEQNNSHFNIQRSADGVDFETIGRVNSQSVKGNSNLKLSYSTVDNSPVIGNNYYRLEQVDFDGQKSFSDIKELMWNEIVGLSFYPNPVVDVINLSWSSDALEVKIRDMQGKLLLTANKNSVDVRTLPQGLYLLEVTQKGKREVRKFIKK